MSGDEIIKYDNKLQIYIFSDMDIYLFACITFKFLKAQLILSKNIELYDSIPNYLSFSVIHLTNFS